MIVQAFVFWASLHLLSLVYTRYVSGTTSWSYVLSAASKQFPIFRRLEVRLHGAVLSAEYRFATNVKGGGDSFSSSSSISSDGSSSNSNGVGGGSVILNAINRHKSLLRSFYSVGMAVMAVANIVAPLYLLKAIYGLFFPNPDLPTFQQSQVDAPDLLEPTNIVTPIIPGLNFPWQFALEFWICAVIAIAVHEFGHFVAALSENVHVPFFGVFIAGIMPGGYISTSDDIATSLPLAAQMRVISAGIWHNVIFAVVCICVLYSTPFLLTATIFSRVDGVLVASDYRYLHAGDLITHIDRCRISGPSSVQHSFDTGQCFNNPDYTGVNYLGTAFKSFDLPVSPELNGYLISMHHSLSVTGSDNISVDWSTSNAIESIDSSMAIASAHSRHKHEGPQLKSNIGFCRKVRYSDLNVFSPVALHKHDHNHLPHHLHKSPMDLSSSSSSSSLPQSTDSTLSPATGNNDRLHDQNHDNNRPLYTGINQTDTKSMNDTSSGSTSSATTDIASTIASSIRDEADTKNSTTDTLATTTTTTTTGNSTNFLPPRVEISAGSEGFESSINSSNSNNNNMNSSNSNSSNSNSNSNMRRRLLIREEEGGGEKNLACCRDLFAGLSSGDIGAITDVCALFSIRPSDKVLPSSNFFAAQSSFPDFSYEDYTAIMQGQKLRGLDLTCISVGRGVGDGRSGPSSSSPSSSSNLVTRDLDGNRMFCLSNEQCAVLHSSDTAGVCFHPLSEEGYNIINFNIAKRSDARSLSKKDRGRRYAFRSSSSSSHRNVDMNADGRQEHNRDRGKDGDAGDAGDADWREGRDLVIEGDFRDTIKSLLLVAAEYDVKPWLKKNVLFIGVDGPADSNWFVRGIYSYLLRLPGKIVFVLWLLIQLNLSLAVVNTMPIQTLDGSKSLQALVAIAAASFPMQSIPPKSLSSSPYSSSSSSSYSTSSSFNRFNLSQLSNYFVLSFSVVLLCSIVYYSVPVLLYDIQMHSSFF